MNKKLMFGVVIGILLIAFGLKVPLQPQYGEFTTDREIEFKVFGIANEVVVDDNPEFYTPVIKTKPFVLDLEPGEYYWKADNSFLIGKFTIQSEINVRLEKLNESYKIHNLGNTDVDLNLTKRGLLTGAAVLGLGQSLELDIDDDSTVVVSQKLDSGD